MQKKTSFQLPSISLTKLSIFFIIALGTSACSSSNNDEENNPGSTNTGSTNTGSTTPDTASLDTALENFKSVATDAGLTEN